MENAHSETTATGSRASYGIDAPPVVVTFVAIATVGIAGGMLLHSVPRARGLSSAMISVGISFALTAAVMIWSSKVGKFRMRDRIFDSIPWRGDEQVLDVGCGRGMMLIAAAKRLDAGKATGIDLWRSVDQSGNSLEATRRNVELEGVAQRVDLKDGDARALPFADGAFDLVMSSFVVHNMHDRGDRQKALSEMLRVLKSGGWLAMMDIRNGPEYLTFLREQGLSELRTWWRPLFVQRTDAIIARKPGGVADRTV